MHRLSRSRSVLLSIVATLFALGIFSTPGVAIAGDPAPFPMDVVVLTCDEDPGTVPQATIPDGCTGTDGALVTVTDADDNEIGSCTTTTGSCVANIDLSGGSPVTATLASSAIPDGYDAIENPITLEVANEFSGPTFVLVPEETTDLPNTGSGITRTPAQSQGAIVLAGIAFLLAVSGFRLSRRDSPR